MWLYGCELLEVCPYPDKFGHQTHCDSGDLMFLICHLTSRYHMFNELREFMGGSPTIFRGHCSSASGEMMYFICHVNSQDHVIEGCDFMGESSSLYVSILPGLVAIGSVVVETFLIFNVIVQDHVIKGSCDFMGESVSR